MQLQMDALCLYRHLQSFKMNIENLTYKELVDLNRKIVERLKFLDHIRAHSEMMEFSVGDKVFFTPPGRGQLSGILAKYNRKTVTIVTEDGERWNVSPMLLTKATHSPPKAIDINNVIDISDGETT